MNQPPVIVQMNENEIILTDVATGISKTFNPNSSDFKIRHAHLYGVWSSAYAEEKENGGR